MPTSRSHMAAAQRGITLIEALIAFLVLAFGMLALAQLPKQLRLQAEVARQRGEAVRLAQSELEALRAASAEAATAPDREVEVNGTRYRLTRRVAADPAGAARHLDVELGWTDRRDGGHTLALGTIDAGVAPALGAALGLARTEALARGAAGRSPRVPLHAVDLGDGRSALKPVAAETVAVLFDNLTGLVTGHCTGVDPALATAGLTRDNLGPCDAVAGLSISGTVRFTAAVPPDPARANDPPLAFAPVARPTLGTDPVAARCASEALKTVAFDRPDGSRRLAAVPIAALPATLGLTAWTETGERFARYHCTVYPGASARWSGRIELQPSGWTIGTVAGAWRVCRFVHDVDGNGSVDRHAEHPPRYEGLDASLANQNFLVVAGAAACPAGNNTGLAVDPSTAPHQP